MDQEGLKFIGIVKTTHRKFILKHLQSIELQKRGDRVGIFRRKKEGEGECDLLAFAWMDRERRYFICSGSNMSEGLPNIRQRLRQEDEEPNAVPELLALVIDQPNVCELYYACCAIVDRHNRCRQADLQLEKKLVTKDWSKRLNISLLSICIVDTWFAYSSILETHENQNDFYEYLAEELIENIYDDNRSVNRTLGDPRRRLNIDLELSPRTKNDGSGRCGLSIHLTATKRKRISNQENVSTNVLQGRCKICANKTTMCCSKCEDDDKIEKAVFLCNPKTNRMCFAQHVKTCIDDES